MKEVETCSQQIVNPSTCSLLTVFALEELPTAESLCVPGSCCGLPSPSPRLLFRTNWGAPRASYLYPSCWA